MAWSPSSSLWGRLLNFEADRALAPEESPSIVRTPLVFAMWEPMAEALGYPEKPIGLLGHPRARHVGARAGPSTGDRSTAPSSSSTPTRTTPPPGSSAVVAEYYAATGKKEGLTVAGHPLARGARAGQGDRAVDRPLRRHDAVHRRPDARERSRLRVGGRDGGGDAAGLQRGPRRSAEADRDLPGGGDLLLRQPVHRPRRPVGVAGASARARSSSRSSSPRRSRPPSPPRAASAPPTSTRSRSAPSTPSTAPTPRSPPASSACPSPRCSPPPRRVARGPQAGQHPARPRHVRLDAGRGPARARQGGPRGLLPRGRPIRTVSACSPSTRTSASPLPLARVPARAATTSSAPSRNLIADGGTAFYDAAVEGFEAVRELDDDERINAVVLLTDGEDTDSSRSFDQAARGARAARATRRTRSACSRSPTPPAPSGAAGAARGAVGGHRRQVLRGHDGRHRVGVPLDQLVLLARRCTGSRSRPTRRGSTSTTSTPSCARPTGPPGIPRATVERAIAGSLNFGLYGPDAAPAGFARVVSDRATFAYLADVFVDPAHRGLGLGAWLVETVLAHPELQGLRRWALATATPTSSTRASASLRRRAGKSSVHRAAGHLPRLVRANGQARVRAP